MNKNNQALKIITATAVILAVILGAVYLMKKRITPIPATTSLEEYVPKGPIAKAIFSTPLSPGSSMSFSIYDVRINRGEFNITDIEASKGDDIQMKVTAVDKDYDFSVSRSGITGIKIKRGETKSISFQVNDSGMYRFYCKICGGSESQPNGVIIVKP